MRIRQPKNIHLSLISAFLVLLSALSFSMGRAEAQATPALTDEALVKTLRAGGYNLYLRHMATNWSQQDTVHEAGDWLSCNSNLMRQLSSAGRETASAVGEAIRSLGIPIGKVLASPYCRTVESARLMQLGTVEIITDVMNLRAAGYFGGRASIIATARARLGTSPEPGTNTLIVAHGNVAREATAVYPDEGEVIVFQPDGDAGFHYIARIASADWPRITQALLR